MNCNLHQSPHQKANKYNTKEIYINRKEMGMITMKTSNQVKNPR